MLGGPLVLGGVTFTEGLGTKNYADGSFKLDGGFKRFRGRVGFDDSAVRDDANHAARMSVEVRADGRVVFATGTFTTGQTFDIDVSVAGAQRLEIVAGGKDDFSRVDVVGAVER